MSADKLKSYDLKSDHKLRYFLPEINLASLLGRVQKFLDLHPDLFLVDLQTKGYYDGEEARDQVWEATLTYFGEANDGQE
jgi:hypothetical protein